MFILVLLDWIISIIWIIDILNIDFIIKGIHVAEFLDSTVPINTLFWILYFFLTPSIMSLFKKGDN